MDALDAVTGRKTVHDRPQGPGRAADDGLPGAHAQRHAEAARNKAEILRDARRQGRRGRRHRRGGARQDLRPVHRRDPRDGGRLEPRPGRRPVRRRHPGRSCKAASCRWPRPRQPARQDHRGPSSPSTSAATPRSTPTPRSPTSARTGPRSGSALKSPIAAQAGRSPRRSACRRRGQGARDHGRRLVRPPAVLRRARSRPRRSRKAMGKPVQADVAPRRRRPGRPRAPDGHVADPRDLRRRPRCWPSSRRTPASRPTTGTGSARCSPRWPPTLPAGLGNLGFAESDLRAAPRSCPTTSAVSRQQLDETDDRFNTGSMRNIYSPDVRTAGELIIDQARRRRWARTPTSSAGSYLRDDRASRRCSRRWPRPAAGARRCAPGTAQGIAIHKEYKGATACLVEIDCRRRDRRPRDPRRRRPARG